MCLKFIIYFGLRISEVEFFVREIRFLVIYWGIVIGRGFDVFLIWRFRDLGCMMIMVEVWIGWNEFIDN